MAAKRSLTFYHQVSTKSARAERVRERPTPPGMLVAWSWLLTSATAIHGPILTARTRRVCIARAGPAIALFGSTDDVLRELDALKPTLSYQGWQRDVAEVESAYTRYSHSSSLPARTLAKVRRKQQLHDGDRSDALLRQLDMLKPTLSYPGWQRDVAEVERDYTRHSHGSSVPARTLAKVRWKQHLHDVGRNDAFLRELDALKPTLSYEGWQRDVDKVERDYAEYPGSAISASTLAKVRWKQHLHDRVHKASPPPPPPIANTEVPPPPLSDATSTVMPTASCARITRTDAGTLEIYIPPGRTTLSETDEVATIGVLLSALLPAAFVFDLPRLLAPLLSFGVGLFLKRRLINPTADTTLTIGQYAWKLRRTVAGVVTQEEEGATDTLRGADTLLLFRHRGVYRTELRLYAAGKQAVIMDVVLQSSEEGDALAANVNAYLHGLETAPENDAGEEIKQEAVEGSLNSPRAHGGVRARMLAHVRRWW